MTILAYHKVDDRFELGLTNVRPKMFTKQIQSLKDSGVRLLKTLDEASSNGHDVYLTFDDGYDCFYRNVAPALAAANTGATVFVISDYVGKSNGWDIRLSYKPFHHMSGTQLREIAALGFEIGSHSCSHVDLTRISWERVLKEMVDSKMRIEDLIGRQVESFSFPFGRCNLETVDAARHSGYAKLFGLGSKNVEGVFKRIPVYRIDTPASVREKVALNGFEIAKSNFIHSFAGISALISVRRNSTST